MYDPSDMTFHFNFYLGHILVDHSIDSYLTCMTLVTWPFTLTFGHIFSNIGGIVFIFGMHDPFDQTFPMG